MKDDITYNQIISFEKNALVKCHHTKRSFIEKGMATPLGGGEMIKQLLTINLTKEVFDMVFY